MNKCSVCTFIPRIKGHIHTIIICELQYYQRSSHASFGLYYNVSKLLRDIFRECALHYDKHRIAGIQVNPPRINNTYIRDNDLSLLDGFLCVFSCWLEAHKLDAFEIGVRSGSDKGPAPRAMRPHKSMGRMESYMYEYIWISWDFGVSTTGGTSFVIMMTHHVYERYINVRFYGKPRR